MENEQNNNLLILSDAQENQIFETVANEEEPHQKDSNQNQEQLEYENEKNENDQSDEIDGDISPPSQMSQKSSSKSENEQNIQQQDKIEPIINDGSQNLFIDENSNDLMNNHENIQPESDQAEKQTQINEEIQQNTLQNINSDQKMQGSQNILMTEIFRDTEMHESVVLNQEINQIVEDSNYEYKEVAIGENFEDDEDFDNKEKEKSEPQRNLLGAHDEQPEPINVSEFGQNQQDIYEFKQIDNDQIIQSTLNLDQSNIQNMNTIDQSSYNLLSTNSASETFHNPQSIRESMYIDDIDYQSIDSQIINNQPIYSVEIYSQNIRNIQDLICQGKFRQVIPFIQDYLIKVSSIQSEQSQNQPQTQQNVIDHEMNTLLQIILVFCFIKLNKDKEKDKDKEYQHATLIATECLKKYQNQQSNYQQQNTHNDEIPFSLQYLHIVSLYCQSNSRNKKQCLIQLYKLQKQYNYDSKDIFIDFQSDSNQKQYDILHLIRTEQQEVFGLFPKKNDVRSKYIMISLEIFRIHHRALDFKNAYTVLLRLNERVPNNPMIISRLGLYCLEIGKKLEAESHFQLIQDILQRKRAQEEQLKQLNPLDVNQEDNTELLDNLLSENDTNQMKRSTTITKSPNILNKETKDLIVSNLLNQAFVCIYDGNFEDSVQFFRQIQTYKPANTVASSNLTTCNIFLNKT